MWPGVPTDGDERQAVVTDRKPVLGGNQPFDLGDVAAEGRPGDLRIAVEPQVAVHVLGAAVDVGLEQVALLDQYLHPAGVQGHHREVVDPAVQVEVRVQRLRQADLLDVLRPVTASEPGSGQSDDRSDDSESDDVSVLQDVPLLLPHPFGLFSDGWLTLFRRNFI